MTPLQAFLRALGDLVGDAREELTETEYGWFVAIACAVGVEAARLFLGEALPATRREEDAA